MIPAQALAMVALLFQAADAPRSQELQGPMMVCFRYSAFSLNADERMVVTQLGLHGVSVEVDGPTGSYRVSENEIYRTPAHPGTRVHQENGATVFRSFRRPVSYAFLSRTALSSDRPRMIAVIAGDALTGGAGDASIYRRLKVGDPSQMRCDHRYGYGWSAVLGHIE